MNDFLKGTVRQCQNSFLTRRFRQKIIQKILFKKGKIVLND
jgi:hypothetical protein